MNQKDWANRGSNHHNWVENPSYDTRHDRLRRARGKASDHACVDCNRPAAEWSQVHDTDGLDTQKDYEPRCKKCHHEYDRESWIEGIGKRDTSRISSAASETNRNRWKDPTFRAKMSVAIADSNRRRAAREKK